MMTEIEVHRMGYCDYQLLSQQILYYSLITEIVLLYLLVKFLLISLLILRFGYQIDRNNICLNF